MRLYVFILSLIEFACSYKPVVLVHGVLSEASHLLDLKNLIETHHPGTNVTLVKMYPEIESFVPLNRQLPYWLNKILPIMQKSPDGIHLVCHSQGGLICQGIIETCDEHNINTFIALSSPMNGQYGIPLKILSYAPWLKGERQSLTKYMYMRLTQDTFAISNYWKDPRATYREEYATSAHYLPGIQNNPLATRRITDPKTQSRNFLKLKQLVLVGGPQDDVIIPWQSSVYGFYDNNMDMVQMENQTVFVEDWFGLKTLYNQNKVRSFVLPGVKHVEWHGNKKVFRLAIEPFLD